jgi:ABC-2 type transport system ATP-binding protein
MSAVVQVEHLRKDYRSVFLLRPVTAVHDVTFQVEEGQVFGILGPNGAGKTTTIRVLMGLISATAGVVELFGAPAPSRESRKRIGFLPESPYFYDYLTVTELIDLAGRLCGVDRKTRRARTEELIAMVGLEHARNTRLKKYSKGMLQRAGIAQALIHDPDLVLFDEPMTGLDPVGRKEVRDIITGLAERGKTVLFSSHILADVEMLCDHLAIIVGGKVRGSGALSELVDTTVTGFDISLGIDPDFADESVARLEAASQRLRRSEREIRLFLSAEQDADELLALARELGARVRSVEPSHQTLEDLFLAATRQAGDAGEEEA